MKDKSPKRIDWSYGFFWFLVLYLGLKTLFFLIELGTNTNGR